MNETKFITVKNKLPIVPMVFLGFVIIITLALVFYNFYLDKSNDQILKNIANRETSIMELNSDPKIQIYSLLEANSFAFSELEKRNKVTTYIKHLDSMSKIYNLELDGFNFSDGKLTTVATVMSSLDGGIAYNKTVKFIKNYRESENALFKLNFISSIDGSADSMKFNLDLDLK